MNNYACPCCKTFSNQHKLIIDLGTLPLLANALTPMHTPLSSVKKGAFQLRLCNNCEVLWNSHFDISALDYALPYENSLFGSAVFRSFAGQLIDHIATIQDFTHKMVVEIGCGDGLFLQELCNRTASTGYGFDPGAIKSNSDSMTITNDYIDLPKGEEVSMIVCRHVLEHVHDPLKFLSDLKRDFPNALLYLEVPNADYMIEKCMIWDLIYEHHTYFTLVSLHTLVNLAGYHKTKAFKSFNDQYLSIVLNPSEGEHDPEPPKQYDQATLDNFKTNAQNKVQDWNTAVNENQDGSWVIWGAGSKTNTFLNTINYSRLFRAAVDLNPKKWNHLVSGTSVPIIGPNELSKYDIDQVVISNPIYEHEIRRQLDDMGIKASTVLL